MEKHSEADIHNILCNLGYKLIDCGNHWRSQAIYRNGSNANSLCIFKDSGVWKDYGSNGESKPFSELVKMSGGTLDGTPLPQHVPNASEDVEEDRIYPDSSLQRLMPHHKFYIDKGIPLSVLQRLNGGMAMSGKMYQRYVFPIYNKSGQIFGFAGRDMANNPERPKWKIIGRKKNFVYPLYCKDKYLGVFVRDEIINKKSVYLVESIGDMLSMHGMGIFNVLVTFGLKIPPALVLAMIELNPEKIYICFNDDSSKKVNSGLFAAVREYLELLSHFDASSLFICLPLKNDFGDMDSIDFAKWRKKVDSLNNFDQIAYICGNIQDMMNRVDENGKPQAIITKKSLKNLKYIECET